jgi:hypothetical protein
MVSLSYIQETPFKPRHIALRAQSRELIRPVGLVTVLILKPSSAVAFTLTVGITAPDR